MEPNIAKCNKQGRLVSHIEYMLQLPRKENVWQYQGHCQWCPAPHLKSVLPDFTFGLTNYHETVKMPCAVVDGHQAITCWMTLVCGITLIILVWVALWGLLASEWYLWHLLQTTIFDAVLSHFLNKQKHKIQTFLFVGIANLRVLNALANVVQLYATCGLPQRLQCPAETYKNLQICICLKACVVIFFFPNCLCWIKCICTKKYLFCARFCVVYWLYNQLRRYGPTLTLHWETSLDNICFFYLPLFATLLWQYKGWPNGLYRESCFSNSTKSWWIRLFLQLLRGRFPPWLELSIPRMGNYFGFRATLRKLHLADRWTDLFGGMESIAPDVLFKTK